MDKNNENDAFLDDLIALAEQEGWTNLPRSEPSFIILEWA